MQLTPNTLYTFDFTNQVQFGDLSPDTLKSIFRDGRFVTELIARYLEQTFDDLDYQDKKYIDFFHPTLGNIEQKQVTHNGFHFCPSNHKGQGRKVNRQFVEDLINKHDLSYLVVSITRFPLVYVKLVHGDYLLEQFPQKGCGSSSIKSINSIFGFPAE